MQIPLRNIIFDLGGVLLDIDYQRPVRAFTNLGYPNFEQMYNQSAANELFERLETGHSSNDEFLAAMAALAPAAVTHEQITTAWNSIMLRFRPASMAFLARLRQRYNIYLLSNTNSIHFDGIQMLYRQETGGNRLEECFTKAWYSFQLGLRKPGREIYEFVLRDGNLQAAETLFIDDSAVNMEAAQALGIRTHLLLPGQTIEGLDYEAI